MFVLAPLLHCLFICFLDVFLCKFFFFYSPSPFVSVVHVFFRIPCFILGTLGQKVGAKRPGLRLESFVCCSGSPAPRNYYYFPLLLLPSPPPPSLERRALCPGAPSTPATRGPDPITHFARLRLPLLVHSLTAASSQFTKSTTVIVNQRGRPRRHCLLTINDDSYDATVAQTIRGRAHTKGVTAVAPDVAPADVTVHCVSARCFPCLLRSCYLVVQSGNKRVCTTVTSFWALPVSQLWPTLAQPPTTVISDSSDTI